MWLRGCSIFYLWRPLASTTTTHPELSLQNASAGIWRRIFIHHVKLHLMGKFHKPIPGAAVSRRSSKHIQFKQEMYDFFSGQTDLSLWYDQNGVFNPMLFFWKWNNPSSLSIAYQTCEVLFCIPSPSSNKWANIQWLWWEIRLRRRSLNKRSVCAQVRVSSGVRKSRSYQLRSSWNTTRQKSQQTRRKELESFSSSSHSDGLANLSDNGDENSVGPLTEDLQLPFDLPMILPEMTMGGWLTLFVFAVVLFFYWFAFVLVLVFNWKPITIFLKNPWKSLALALAGTLNPEAWLALVPAGNVNPKAWLALVPAGNVNPRAWLALVPAGTSVCDPWTWPGFPGGPPGRKFYFLCWKFH